MVVLEYDNIEWIYDPSNNFLMNILCYENGCKCSTCKEYTQGECSVDDVWDFIYKNKDLVLKSKRIKVDNI